MIGQKLLHYEVVQKLGEGGMGVVYKARDTHLDRFVAIKVLPPERVADAQRKARFVQEAKAASALNHPNIITVHDIASDKSGDISRDFIVMEYVAGKTLDQLIPRKGMHLNETLKIGVQISDALSRAHAAGIIHRDLKPANIMVDEHGLVKVLDFGLAKLTEPVAQASACENAPTKTVKPHTEEGAIVGTAGYMSPEQVEGKTLDARSDIFSFGAVLYEMVTGRRAFQGDSKMATLSAVLHREPPPVEGAPPELERILARCLRKDLERRTQHMVDVKLALQELKEESDSGKLSGTSQAPRRARVGPRWIATVFAVLAAAIAAVWLGVSSGRVPPPSDPVPLTSYPGFEGEPAFSPDGNQVAFVWDGEKRDNRDIYVKQIGSGNPLRLTTDAADDFSPAWSPDGRWIAFLRSLPGDRAAVLLVPPLGGPERSLSEVSAPGWWMSGPYVAWSPDSASLALVDREPATPTYCVFLLSVDSGGRQRLTSPTATAFSDTSPAFSPDGRNLAFCRWRGTSALHVLALTPTSQPAGEPKQLTSGDWWAGSPSWVETVSWYRPGARRDIVFSSVFGRGGLWRVAASGSRVPERLAFAGEGASYQAISARSHRLVYTRSLGYANIARIDLASGATTPLIGSTRGEWNPMFSPEGKRIVFQSNRSGFSEIWVSNSDGADAVQLTSFGAPMAGSPRWSPDGNSIVFDSNLEGQFEEYVVSAAGGKPRRLTTHPANDLVGSYSSDGRWLYFGSNRSGDFQIWKMPAGGGEAVQVTRQGGFVGFDSPDGKWFYYLQTVGERGSLWRVPASGGEETKLLESVIGRAFAVTAEGIYYLTDAGAQRSRASLQFLSFATGQTKLIAAVENPGFGLTVSPDRRQVLYTRTVQEGSDLMLVENFR